MALCASVARRALVRSAAARLAGGRFASSASSAPLEYASSCFLPTDWTSLPLVARREVTADTSIYEFGLPAGQSLDLPVCACILLRAPGCGADGADVVRPYTPISDSATTGKFELLVKRYPEGAASQYLHGLTPGATTVDFKHIKFNIKAQYPFPGKKTFTMVCGGTGITPMYQALLKLLGTPGDDRQTVLLYGSKSPDDILLRDELDALAKAHPERLRVVHVVGDRPDASAPTGWASTPTHTAEVGWIDERKLREHAFPPSDDTLVFVCGVPAHYEALCGPRTEAELGDGTILHRLGYTASQITKM